MNLGEKLLARAGTEDSGVSFEKCILYILLK